MDSKVLVGGAVYKVKGGRTLIEGTGYDVKSGKTLIGGTGYGITFVDTTLNNNDWSVISETSSAGTAANYWSVGDTKAVAVSGTVGTLSVSGTYYAYILGFSHNSTYEGSNRIHFGCFKTAQTSGIDVCLVDSKYNSLSNGGSLRFNLNHSGSDNSGGWASCNLRSDVLGSDVSPSIPTSGTLLAAFSSDLRASMKSVTKYTDNTAGGNNSSSYVTATTDYLWLLAEFEIHGDRTYANSSEKNKQAQYTYYSSGNSKIKYKYSDTSTAAYWWTRSVNSRNDTSFCLVDKNGSYTVDGSYYSYGLAPAFAA
ncbi:MAG: hypothetical protein H6Q60_1428 [Oscillospiraceae bacterium]|nr:hypothetical protein [Oscillospiraceae bacterium]